MNYEDNTQNNEQAERRSGSGLYVDVENLQDDGQQLIEALIDNWPTTVPDPSRLVLYVPADRVELWKVWATSRFKTLKVVVNGIQHFMSSSKNSADIAIATKAVSDLLLNRITYVVVLSDDSDFAHLYTAIRDELPQAQIDNAKVPFLWAVTNRKDTLSATVKQFFPDDLLHLIVPRIGLTKNSKASETSKKDIVANSPTAAKNVLLEMAQEIIRQIPVGTFRSTECKELIKKGWTDHAMATAGEPAFGPEFKKNLWPILQGYGVEIPNPGNKPIRYEMTEKAKESLL